jgi:hypothetical protein
MATIDETFLKEHIGGPFYSKQKQNAPAKPTLEQTMATLLPTDLPLAENEQEAIYIKQACERFYHGSGTGTFTRATHSCNACNVNRSSFTRRGCNCFVVFVAAATSADTTATAEKKML